MSIGSTAGFTGGDALLALAALQQSNWNDQMSTEMRLAQLQSDMASDLASIKSHLETANQNPARMPALQEEINAFMEKYGEIPELKDVTDAVDEIGEAIDRLLPRTLAASGDTSAAGPVTTGPAQTSPRNAAGPVVGSGAASTPDAASTPEPSTPPTTGGFEQRQVDNWLETLTDKLDSCSTNDQLRMIHIKQLNDNINTNTGMVSGLIESANNTTMSIINTFA